MKIQICAVKGPALISIHEKKFTGFWISFASTVMIGDAILITEEVHTQQNLLDREIFVEFSWEKITGMQIAGPGTENGIQMQHDAGTYHVRGVVDRVDWDGVAIISVVPGSLFLPITVPDSLHLKEGDRVEFTIHGLVLWDENF
nr:hypothetical protein [Candidatus Sigynarchaeota archaeon]